MTLFINLKLLSKTLDVYAPVAYNLYIPINKNEQGATTMIVVAHTKQELVAMARAEYIETANITMNADYALVCSQSSDECYKVEHDGQTATSCECDDRYYRKTTCKHMEAVNFKLAQPVKPAKPAKVKQPRRSAANTELVVSLQLPAGVKVRKSRKAGLVVVAPVVEVIPEVAFHVCGQVVSAPTAAQALLIALELITTVNNRKRLAAELDALVAEMEVPQEVVTTQVSSSSVPVDVALQGALNGNRGFSLMRK
jgi:hypothetical protein